ncbi:type II secretion system F family protein [Parahaliea maris]|uniref:Type II secretion system F family protein n=1 Tax=Parahaliea maris TaxID=2716870 RepID=A0A5C8ZTU8_9GAMM|nr:type II secretion system F family protein [Parahaliea maris]TXS91214.1 type II secretion system F family protein [Parahaliea maris]
MAVFTYQAITTGGETRRGDVYAASEQEAVDKIQMMGLIVLDIGSDDRPRQVTAGPLRLMTRQGLGHRDIVDFTRQVSTLVAAGLPLDRALDIIRSVASLPPLVSLVEKLQEKIRSGDSFSTALRGFPQYFSDFYVSLVRSAELSGNLGECMSDLSRYLDRAKALRDQLTSALIYPLILVVVTVISLAVIFTYVLPEFAQMFEDMNAELPASAAFVLGTADFFNQYGWVLLLVLIVGYFYLRQLHRDEQRRLAWDSRLLTLPLVGGLVGKIEMARFSRSLGTLLKGGVPLMAALEIASESLRNRLMTRRLLEAAADIGEGTGLAASLMDSGVFPEFALQMIQVGEETGELDSMLLQVAEIYDEEVGTATTRMLSIVEPVMIVGLAVVIGGIVISILSAILSINEIPV